MKPAHEMNEIATASGVKWQMTILKAMLEDAGESIEKAAKAGDFQTMYSGQYEDLCKLLKKELESFGYSCSEPEYLMGADQNEYRMAISWSSPGYQAIE